MLPSTFDLHVGAFRKHGIEMRGEDQVGMRGFAGTHADDVAGFVGADVAQAEAFEQPLQFAPAHFFLERRRGDLANLDLLLDDRGLVALDGFEGRADRPLVHQLGRRLREGGYAESCEQHRGDPNSGVHRAILTPRRCYDRDTPAIMHTNRLANEKSPYLLQHAHNPVDWHAWGPEAFEKARAEDKPIFLSIGYSTCHWCHVMERESFENDGIAELLNRDFVSIKVDREERPDVDRIYMTFVQATTGSGGWPMSVWLTPELKPFFGGTYFPPENRWGSPGFASVLTQIASAWRTDRDKIDDSARDVIEQLQEVFDSGRPRWGGASTQAFSKAASRCSAARSIRGWADSAARPSFRGLRVHNFLLRYYARTKNQEALDMVLLTLREMAKGGMNDQLGGGFHRYSVDDRWFVPHFEKMLYDQGQLAAVVSRSVSDYAAMSAMRTQRGGRWIMCCAT